MCILILIALDMTLQSAEELSNASNERRPTTFRSELPNPALWTDEHHDVYMKESPVIEPGPHDCVVRMRCNGICGSDLHFWKVGVLASLVVSCPYVLGHEGAGEVVWAGSQVTTLQPGDRVSVEPGVTCGTCYECTSGNYNLCRTVEFSGAPPYHGSIRRYHTHPAKWLHKIPDNMSWANGALLEPLSVVMHGFERSPVKIADSTVVLGAGPIGLIALKLARLSGAMPIVITDIDPSRLEFAKRFVPGCLPVQFELSSSPQENADKAVRALREAGGDLPKVVYECTGVESSVAAATYIPRPAGEVMVIGVGKPLANNMPLMHLSLAEVDLKFINRYNHSWPKAIRLLSSDFADLTPIVTHQFKLEEADEAIKSAADRSKGVIKAHIIDD